MSLCWVLYWLTHVWTQVVVSGDGRNGGRSEDRRHQRTQAGIVRHETVIAPPILWMRQENGWFHQIEGHRCSFRRNAALVVHRLPVVGRQVEQRTRQLVRRRELSGSQA